MSEPVVAGAKPLLVRFDKAGDAKFWCACGRSADQPFCDGSHKGTPFRPVRIVARVDGEEALLCACKQTKSPPYCDGSHNALGAYDDGTEEGAIDFDAATFVSKSAGRADLDGACYVLTPDWRGAERLAGIDILPTITSASGADRLSQYLLRASSKATQAISFGDAEVVLFLANGSAQITIGGARFDVAACSAVALRPGEAFAIDPAADGVVEIVATVCPPSPPRIGAGAAFDRNFPNRVTPLDDTERKAMGARFYQVLTSAEKGASEVTEFIGAIPQSRAAAHRHLYEETLIVLSGEGVMWTQGRKARVGPGDIIYLPRKQVHSLECTAAEGMVLAGSFFPAGSPAINY